MEKHCDHHTQQLEEQKPVGCDRVGLRPAARRQWANCCQCTKKLGCGLGFTFAWALQPQFQLIHKLPVDVLGQHFRMAPAGIGHCRDVLVVVLEIRHVQCAFGFLGELHRSLSVPFEEHDLQELEKMELIILNY